MDKKKQADYNIFRKDIPNMILLVILYGFQGLPMGLFLNSIPLLFKQYLTYKEIGVVMMSTMPYSFKVFWAPIVELYHIPGVGKRKSWVIPTQLVGCIILFYLSRTINDLLMSREVYFLTGILIFNTFIITCQDIAVDSWASEIMHPANASYSSSA